MAVRKAGSDSPPQEQEDARSLEECMKELDTITERLQSPALAMEDSVNLYRQGMEMVARCESMIDRTKQQLLQITEEAGLTPLVFDED